MNKSIIFALTCCFFVPSMSFSMNYLKAALRGLDSSNDSVNVSDESNESLQSLSGGEEALFVSISASDSESEEGDMTPLWHKPSDLPTILQSLKPNEEYSPWIEESVLRVLSSSSEEDNTEHDCSEPLAYDNVYCAESDAIIPSSTADAWDEQSFDHKLGNRYSKALTRFHRAKNSALRAVKKNLGTGPLDKKELRALNKTRKEILSRKLTSSK